MRYQKIYVQIWNDEKFIELSEPSKVFFLYLLTSPHSNVIGAFVMKKGYVAEDLKWSIQKVEKAIKELTKDKLIMFDKKVSVITINNFLKYNPLENPNQFIGASNIYKTLPRTSNLSSIYNTLVTLSQRFNKPLGGALKPEAVTVTDSVAETETETATEIKREDIVFDFDSVWIDYPNKDGKRAALKSFNSTVKSEQDYQDIQAALTNYLFHLQHNDWKKPKNGSTWFNNWQDWVVWQEPEKTQRKANMGNIALLSKYTQEGQVDG